jgi:hypothetical protein
MCASEGVLHYCLSRGEVVVALKCRNSEKALLRGYRECAIVLSGTE